MKNIIITYILKIYENCEMTMNFCKLSSSGATLVANRSQDFLASQIFYVPIFALPIFTYSTLDIL